MESTEKTLCPQCVERLARTEKCIRENPRQAALVSLGAGFLLAQFPLGLLIAAMLRLVLLVLKPVAILYGLYRLVEDGCCRRGHEEETEEATPEI